MEQDRSTPSTTLYHSVQPGPKESKYSQKTMRVCEIIYRRACKAWLNPLKSANAKDPVHMQMLLLNIIT